MNNYNFYDNNGNLLTTLKGRWAMFNYTQAKWVQCVDGEMQVSIKDGNFYIYRYDDDSLIVSANRLLSPDILLFKYESREGVMVNS